MSGKAVERAIERAMQAGAAESDAVLIESDALEARVRGEEIDFVKQAREKTLGIRVLVQGKSGLRSAVTSTSDLAPEMIDKMAGETVELAHAIAEDPTAGLPEEAFAEGLPDLDLFDPGDRPWSVEDRIDAARRAESAARDFDPRIVNSEGSQVSADFSRVVYGSSKGFLGEYEKAGHSLFAEPLAEEGGSKQRDYWMTVARRLSDLDAPEDVGRRAAERAVRRLGGRQVPTCEAAVIFDSMTAPSLLGQLSQCLNGYSVYRGTSFLAGRIGEQIAVPGFNLIDDGRRPGGLGSKPFDGEGLATRRNQLVENGELRTYLLDSYSARKLSMNSTGNATRSVSGPPAAGSTNLWLEPGAQTLDELIAATDKGLLVTELIGMGFNPVTGDYSRGAAGLWIEKGKIVHPVEEVTIAGNFGAMLESIDAIGSELVWHRSVASPPLRIAKMTIAGA
ncbi:MAG: TldD/PmbA family protein [bacterium]|nr:TldD/PmbA family protein [bacterium]